MNNWDLDSDSDLNLFDQKNPDRVLFNLVDDELIKLSGSKILYYKYIPTNEYDDVYKEDRNKVIMKQPILVWGSYDPQVIEELVGKFGVEDQSPQEFTFNRDYIRRKLGRDPISGDIIKPIFQNIKFKITQARPEGFEIFGIYHTLCDAIVLRDSPESVDQFMPKTSREVGDIVNE